MKKIAIVTGGKTGIGKATCEALSNKEITVYALDIKTENIQNNHINYLKCDIRKYEEVKACIEEIYKKEGQIDYLFSNAGIHLFANIEDTSIDDFENVLSVNLKGTFYILKEVIPIMKKQNKGSIVLMGSDQCFVGKGNSSVYGLTKGAIAQLTKSTAIDYAAYNIRVNAVCPGTIETPLYHNAVDYFSDISGIDKNAIYEGLNQAQPIKRVGTPEEVAKAVMFLLSDESSYITGTLLSIDGGYTCQ